jgi:hypothetical protein
MSYNVSPQGEIITLFRYFLTYCETYQLLTCDKPGLMVSSNANRVTFEQQTWDKHGDKVPISAEISLLVTNRNKHS